MSKLLEGRNLICFDFEVMAHSISPETGKPYWCVVFIDIETGKGKIIKNNIEELREFYEGYKHDIFISYNGRNYDQWIFKGLLLGYCPAHLTKKIIEDNVKGGMLVRNHNKIPLFHYDAANKFNSLKQLQAFMGSEIKDADVPFDLNRPMTDEEEKELVKYCVHDVKETIKVFNKNLKTFNATIGVLEMFNQDLSLINKTSSQITATILGATKLESHDNEFDFIYPETLKLDKYQFVKDWFNDIKNGKISTNGKVEIEYDIAGVPTTYALGGTHGNLDNYQTEGRIFSIDVKSLYPSLIIQYLLMSRAVDGIEMFKDILHTRFKYKAEKNPLQEALKLILNSVYGCFGDQYNPLYDKRMMRSVCVAGQLLLTDLVEKIEPHCKVLNLNTDGIYFLLEDNSKLPILQEIVKEWENRTRLDMDWEEYKKIILKDVNNYIIVPNGDLYYPNGEPKWKGKGAFVKELSDLDYDLPIVNFAVKNYFVLGTPVENTINNCNELRDFQKIVKVTSAYDQGAWKDCTFSKQPVLNEKTGKYTKKMMWDDGSGYSLKDKTFRVFASNREDDGGLFKKKSNANPAKFANTAEKVFIDNGNVLNKEVPEYLDRQWYIDLANDRIRQFLGLKKEKVSKTKGE